METSPHDCYKCALILEHVSWPSRFSNERFQVMIYQWIVRSMAAPVSIYAIYTGYVPDTGLATSLMGWPISCGSATSDISFWLKGTLLTIAATRILALDPRPCLESATTKA